MRNQPIPACKGNVLHAGTRRSCAGCGGSVRSRHDAKAQPGLPERPDRPSDRWAPHQAARPQEQTARGSGSRSGRFNPKEECRTGRFCWVTFLERLLCSPCKEVSGERDEHRERARWVTALWVMQSKSSAGCRFFAAGF